MQADAESADDTEAEKQRIAEDNAALLRKLRSLDAQIAILDVHGQGPGEREGDGRRLSPRDHPARTPAPTGVSTRPDASLCVAQAKSQVSTPLMPLRRSGSPRALASAMVVRQRAFIGI